VIVVFTFLDGHVVDLQAAVPIGIDRSLDGHGDDLTVRAGFEAERIRIVVELTLFLKLTTGIPSQSQAG